MVRKTRRQLIHTDPITATDTIPVWSSLPLSDARLNINTGLAWQSDTWPRAGHKFSCRSSVTLFVTGCNRLVQAAPGPALATPPPRRPRHTEPAALHSEQDRVSRR